MKWIKDNIIPIVLCVGGGYCLRFLNEYLSLSLNHILQDFLIVGFVIMGFWQKKFSALILVIFTIFSLSIIEFYIPLEWNNLLRGSLIILLLVYLFVWSKNSDLKQREL